MLILTMRHWPIFWLKSEESGSYLYIPDQSELLVYFLDLGRHVEVTCWHISDVVKFVPHLLRRYQLVFAYHAEEVTGVCTRIFAGLPVVKAEM